MASERWEQVELLLHAALSQPVGQRADFLREACGGDEALQRDVESLLGREAAAADFLESPPAAFGADRALSTVTPALVQGQRLGPYVIAERLGAGGMGEVFRAQDTRLRRDVAIKILPSALTSNHERLVRFEREARHLASLNHPNIGAIYGLETLDGAPALILELVPGETLAERIAQGPIPIAAALEYARQIASALEAAHETGMVHRDLKPANIKVTPDGVVKVFAEAGAAAGAATTSSYLDL